MISGIPLGAAAGALLCGTYGAAAAVGGALAGMVAGASAGWVFGFIVIVLLSVVGVLWRVARRGDPNIPPNESEIEVMTRVAVRGTFVSALSGAGVLIGWGWPVALVVVTASAFSTAFVAAARCELRRA